MSLTLVAVADKLAGNDAPTGQGTVKGIALAAIARDKRQDYLVPSRA
jgi:hypothetical protein